VAATQTEQIAASQQRAQIPREWQLEFAEWANDSLQSLSVDPVAHTNVRTYARWELEHRRAFEVLIEMHPETGVAIRLVSDADLDAFDAAMARVKERTRQRFGSVEDGPGKE